MCLGEGFGGEGLRVVGKIMQSPALSGRSLMQVDLLVCLIAQSPKRPNGLKIGQRPGVASGCPPHFPPLPRGAGAADRLLLPGRSQALLGGPLRALPLGIACD